MMYTFQNLTNLFLKKSGDSYSQTKIISLCELLENISFCMSCCVPQGKNLNSHSASLHRGDLIFLSFLLHLVQITTVILQ